MHTDFLRQNFQNISSSFMWSECYFIFRRLVISTSAGGETGRGGMCLSTCDWCQLHDPELETLRLPNPANSYSYISIGLTRKCKNANIRPLCLVTV